MSHIDINMNEFVKLIKQFCPNPKCIVEVGSLDAKDSLFFKDAFPDARCFAIEGLPENYKEFMIQLPIDCINAVVSSENGMVKFHKKKINGLHGIYNRGDSYGTETIELPCFTMEYLIKKHNIPDIDVMKIDVEGSTYEVLVGMNNELNKVKVLHIETESYPFFQGQRLHDEVSEFLRNRKFRLVQLSSIKINKNGFQHDSVWVKNGMANKRLLNDD